jgi:signal peptidase
LEAGEAASESVVAGLVTTMRLSPHHAGRLPDLGTVPAVAGGAPRELRVVVEGRPFRRDWGDLPKQGPVTIAVAPPDSPSMHTIAMMRVADVLARDAQRHGAVLVHSTLAVRDGTGVLLAGTSQVGKSTAARRLPSPWKALSDDTTLVVPDGRGGYLAHPWPTWSRFFDGDAEIGDDHATWDVQRSVPLAGVFILSQAVEDRVEPVAHPAQATALLVDCVEAVSRGMTRDLSRAAARSLHLEQVANVEALVGAIPAYHLEISLTGEFWRLLERVLDELPGTEASKGQTERSDGGISVAPTPVEVGASSVGDVPDLDTDGTFVYTGPSMNPTLAEPQLLETEDVAGTPIHVGDVLCFRSPRDGITVVHRVVEVGAEGIRTRGDRNPSVDPWVLQREDILGRVVQTRRGESTGAVSGGRTGLLVASSGRLRLALGRLARRSLRGAYRGLAETGVGARLWVHAAPPSRAQRIVRFGTGPLAEYRLYLGSRPVGRYDRRLQAWVVDHPWRLVVRESSLPEPPSTVLSPRDRLGDGERQGGGDGAITERAARRAP